jgi:hypothetical protein
LSVLIKLKPRIYAAWFNMTTQRSRLGLVDLFWTSFTAEIHAMSAIELGPMIDAHETDEHPMRRRVTRHSMKVSH